MPVIHCPEFEPDSLPDRVCRWFAASRNAGEVLTRADIMERFGVTAGKHVIEQLQPAVAAGILTHTSNVGYCSGPNLADWLKMANVAAGSQAATTPTPAKGTGRRKTERAYTRLPAIDVAQLQVHRAVTVPPRRSPKGSSKYDAMFDKLDEPRTCFYLPKAYTSAVKKASSNYCKKRKQITLTVRIVSDTQCGVFRTA